MNWRFVKEQETADGLRSRLFACDFDNGGKARRFKRVVQRSFAVPYKLRPGGGVWCAVEFCERLEDGTLTPWRGEWSWPTR